QAAALTRALSRGEREQETHILPNDGLILYNPAPARGRKRQHGDSGHMPSLLFGLPFAALVLAIAIFPLLPHKYAAWWDNNRNKLLVSVALSLVVLIYYFLRSTGFAEHGEPIAPGLATLKHVLHRSILEDYIPFIILLFSLY